MLWLLAGEKVNGRTLGQFLIFVCGVILTNINGRILHTHCMSRAIEFFVTNGTPYFVPKH